MLSRIFVVILFVSVTWSPALAEVDADRSQVPRRLDRRQAIRHRRPIRKADRPDLLRGRPLRSAKHDHHRHRQGAAKRARARGVLLGLLPHQAQQIERGNGDTDLRGVEPRRQRDARLLQSRDGRRRPDDGSTDGRRLPDEAGLHAALGRLAVRCPAARRPRPRLRAHRHRQRQTDRGHRPQRGHRLRRWRPEASLSDRDHIAYPVANPDDPANTLTVRDSIEGPRRFIPKSEWKLDKTRVYLTGGFQPAKIYEVVYKSQDPPVVGVGPAAVRDAIAHLKYAAAPDLSIPAGSIQRAIAFGVSQSGRFLRTYLYYGFNEDEQHRKVFDGVMAHVAGAGRGSFNLRFAQPSRDGHPFLNKFYPTDIFPFTDNVQSRPADRREGWAAAARQAGVHAEDFLHELVVRILGPRGVADSYVH